ncbi:aldo keto reductase [Colletotrichum sojae]|uniref:Aldo keto reductase n=1 Tax=Colletotrichum sojae TaxID=2175907 RepID=A0A8H6JAR5_9PEZI|nr:aldo keto reductase [Colletotrichum sojae]
MASTTMPLPPSLAQSLDSTKCEYRTLGSSGLRVSVPIFGCAGFGDPAGVRPWVLGEDGATSLLKAAYDRGINTWDTANIYSNGLSETFIGKALKKYAIPREKVVLLTKCFWAVGEDQHVQHALMPVEKSKDYQNMFGLSRAAIFNTVEASLRRLDTSYIDVLQVHRFDPNVPIEETMRALNDLVQSGKVRYIGASSMWACQFARMQVSRDFRCVCIKYVDNKITKHVAELHNWTKFISMQNCYNLVYREEEREMIRYCNDTGVGLIPWSPFANGCLTRLPSATDRVASKREQFESKFGASMGRSETDVRIIMRVAEVADDKGWPMSHVSLAWINNRTCSPIVGFTALEKIESTLDGVGKTLTEREEDYLEALYEPKAVYGHR